MRVLLSVIQCKCNAFSLNAFRLALLFIFSIINITASSQSSTRNSVYGTVTDKNGEPLIGVNLTIESSQTFTGTVTGNDGSFMFESLKVGSYTLKASYLGYKTFEIIITIRPENPTQQTIQLTNENFELKDIQITAKSATTRIREQSYEVEAIATKGLENSVRTAKTILNSVSGIRIAEDGGMGSNSTFSLNGFSGNQVKFFMDGISMDNFGSSFSLGDLPVNMIKHIEIYKGVVPVWLGSDALGGAVNIITNNKANYLDVSYAYGSFNTHRVSVNGARSLQNGFIMRGNLFYNYSDNTYKVYVAKGHGDSETKWYSRFHDRYKSATGKLEMGVSDKKYADKLLVGIIATGNHNQQQTGATMAKVYGGVLSESQSLIGTFKYNKRNLFIKGLEANLYAAYSHNKSHAIDSLRGVSYDWSGFATVIPGSNNGELGDRTFSIFNVNDFSGQFNAGYELNTSSKLSFNYAISRYHRTVSDSLNPENENNFFPKDMQKQTLGFSYNYEWETRWNTTLFAKYYSLQANTSKRYDQFLQTERIEKLTSKAGKMGYGLASSYCITPQFQVKLSYEKAFRMPTPLEMFGDGLFVNPNPEIKPESSDNVNISFNYSKLLASNHHIAMGISFLYRNAKDLIYAKISPGNPESSYANSLKIRFLGTEGNLQYKFKDWYHLSANLTYQNITDQAKEIRIKQASGNYWQTNYSYGFRLPNRPYLFGNLSTGLAIKKGLPKQTKLSVDYFLNFTEQYFITWIEMGTNNSKYTIPRQWSHDIQLSFSIKNGRYNISAVCNNIFNSLLYDKYYLQKPGRAFNIKLRMSI